MGRKTSVYLADDILAALAADPRPLAEVIRAGLGITANPVDHRLLLSDDPAVRAAATRDLAHAIAEHGRSDEQHLMALYGPCEHCGAPRATRTVTGRAGSVIEMFCPSCGKVST